LRYLFEEYVFHTDRRELHRGDEFVPVAPQVFGLIDSLIRNKERVVTRENSSKPFGTGAAYPTRRSRPA
jgi:DNA-binding winged helix-turn-helix (wHTH) protein